MRCLRKYLGSLVVATALVLTPSAQAVASVPAFGLDSASPVSNPPSANEFAQMSAAGVKADRIMFFWPQIQTSSLPFYSWKETDAAVGNAAKAGVDALPFFLGSPEWLTGCQGHEDLCQHEPPVKTTAEEDAWESFLREVVQRYGPNGQFWLLHPGLPAHPIHYWQIWNEPDLSGFVGGRASAIKKAPHLYAALLQISSTAIKSVDSSAQIVLGGLSPGPLGGPGTITKFLNKLYQEPGAQASFDICAVHPYAAHLSDLKRLMGRLLKVLKRHHDTAPVWVTEIGWSSSAPGRGTHLDGATNLRKGLNGQAQMVRSSFRAFVHNASRWRLGRVLYFAWRDRAGSNTGAWSNTAGLRRANLSPKPAWHAFTKLMRRFA